MLWFGAIFTVGVISALRWWKDTPAPQTREHIVGHGNFVQVRGNDPAQTLPSPLPDVSDAVWTAFVSACKSNDWTHVSPSNSVGGFAMSPRRLSELGWVSNLARAKSPDGRNVWVARFNRPITPNDYLVSPKLQYDAFTESMMEYAARLLPGGDIAGMIGVQDIFLPSGQPLTRSGLLALLHKGGTGAVTQWLAGNQFGDTTVFVAQANGIF